MFSVSPFSHYTFTQGRINQAKVQDIKAQVSGAVFQRHARHWQWQADKLTLFKSIINKFPNHFTDYDIALGFLWRPFQLTASVRPATSVMEVPARGNRRDFLEALKGPRQFISLAGMGFKNETHLCESLNEIAHYKKTMENDICAKKYQRIKVDISERS